MPRIIPVTDPDDPRLEPYRDVRDRDLRGRDGFMAEGTSVLGNALARSRHRFRSLLVAEPKLAGLESILAGVPEETPVYVAPAYPAPGYYYGHRRDRHRHDRYGYHRPYSGYGY